MDDLDLLKLTRFPEDPLETLRAWDAADAYLLRYLAEHPIVDGSVVVLGDRWGALTTALAADGASVVQVTDSYMSQRATEANLARHGRTAELRTTRDPMPERIRTLLVRVPKNLALLEDLLHRVTPALTADATVIGTGMVKEIHTSTLNLFERIVGPTRTSLAEKKARLIFAAPDPSLDPGRSPWPLTYNLPDEIGASSGRPVVNHAGIFCADRLDIGTRFLLPRLPKTTGPVRIADLGCGNGVLGLAAALTNPDAHLTFIDESHHAVASAQATWEANCPGREATFTACDCLADVQPGTLDIVLNNPPFHSHQAISDRIARRMFAESLRALKPGGELWVVANRHLGHHLTLRRVFGNCETVDGNRKFTVLRAVRRS